jgi:hypothetical protein
MGIKRFFTSKKSKSKPEAENKEMTNVVNSMFLCTPIYDKLKVKCHPDRFIDEKQKIIAQDLFQELQENKYNYEKLLEIELQVNRFESTIQNEH